MRRTPRWLWLAPMLLAVVPVFVVFATRPSPVPKQVCEAQVDALDAWMRHAVAEANEEFMPGDGAKLVGQTFTWRDEFWDGVSPRPVVLMLDKSGWAAPSGIYVKAPEAEALCESLQETAHNIQMTSRLLGGDSEIPLTVAADWNVPWSQVSAALNYATSFHTVRFVFKRRAFIGAPSSSPLDPYLQEHRFHWDSAKSSEAERTRTLLLRAMKDCEQSTLINLAGKLSEMKGAERASLFISAIEEDLRHCSCSAHLDELRSLAWYFIGPSFRRDTVYWSPPVRVRTSGGNNFVRIAFPPNAQLYSIAEALVTRIREAKDRDIVFMLE